MSSPNDWNAGIIKEFRENGGKVTGQFAGMPLVLLNTIGAKSGEPRTNPLAYFRDGERIIIVASKAGAPTNPDWYYNVRANPLVTLEVGTETFKAHATIAEPEERERLFAKIAASNPGFAEYQRNTARVIPIVVLTRAEANA